MIKTYRDEVPPSSGRKYKIETVGEESTITDVTQYEEEGTTFGATDVQGVCILEGTHTVNGTVHNITIGNNNVENMKFKARGDFKTNDTIKINNVLYDIYEPGFALFKTGDECICFLDNINKMIYFSNNQGFKTVTGSTLEGIISYIDSLPIGVHFLIIPASISGTLKIRPLDYICIYTYYKVGNNDIKSMILKGFSSSSNQEMYMADVENNAIRLERIDNNIAGLPNVAVSSLNAFTSYIDNYILAFEVFLTNIPQSSGIGLPSSLHMVEILQSNSSYTLVRATSLDNPVRIKYLRKMNTTWDTNWFEG